MVNKQNNQKPGNVKSTTTTYIDFNNENNKEGPKFEVRDHVRISTYDNIVAKGHAPN